VQAQPLDATVMTAQALPYPNPGDQNCASGYKSSGGYCRPIDERSTPAIPNPGQAQRLDLQFAASRSNRRDRRMGR
jgi:hypothetical protein